MKNCQIKMTDQVYAAIHLAASKRGLTVSSYVRMMAILDAAEMGFHVKQPEDD